MTSQLDATARPEPGLDARPKGVTPPIDHRIVITPPARIPLPKVRELFEAREVLVRFAQRDITLRYRQTALGVVWVVLQPLLGAGVLSFVFGSVAKLPTGGIPPFLFTFVGLTAWNVFSGIVSRGSGSLIGNAGLVSKVYFPRMLVPLSTAGSSICDFAVSLVFLAILLAIYGVAPGPAIALVPIWLVLILCLAGGVALLTSSLMVSFRDVSYIVPFLLQILLFASPIAYSTQSVPGRYRFLYQMDPLTWLLNDVRWSLIDQPRPEPLYLVLSVVVPLVVALVGSLVFEKRERGFADFI